MPADPPPESPGGLGGGYVPPEGGARDTRLLARAVAEEWPLSPDVRCKVLRRLVNIVDPDYIPEPHEIPPGTREVISAARAILLASRINIDARRLAFDERRHEAKLKAQDDCPTVKDVLAEAEAAAESYRPPERGPAP